VFVLTLLGGASLEAQHRPVAGGATQRHRLALLALLAAHAERGRSRDQVLGLLWPERDAEHARHLLNQGVYSLRRALGEAALLSTGDELRLNTAAVRADVVEFEAALARGCHDAAVALYRGPFLDGFFLPDAPEFERWAAGERDRLAAAYARALEALADRAEAEHDLAAAVDRWRARAAHDPYDARVALRLMQALEAGGNRAGALHHAELHGRLLEAEFGVAPAPEVLALARRLRLAPPAPVEWLAELSPGAPSAAVGAETPRPPARPAIPVSEDTPPLAPSARADAAVQPEPPLPATAPLPAALSPPPLRSSPPPSLGTSTQWGRSLAAGALLALLAAGAWRLVPGIRPNVAAASTEERVIVADFTDRTRESTAGDLVAHVLRSELARSRVLSVVGPGATADALRRMRRQPGTRLGGEVAREVAAREEIRAVVEGEVRPAAAGLVITVSVIETATGDVIFGASEMAQDSTQILPAIARVSESIRRGIGESLASIRAGDSLASFTTASLAALRKHMAGSRAYWRGEYETAAALLDDATALDPEFAHAYLLRWSALAYSGAPRGRALAPLVRAYRLRHRLTEPERDAVEGQYLLNVAGELPGAVVALRKHVEGLRTSPAGEPRWYATLGLALALRGELRDAASVLEEARLRFPTARNQLNLVRVRHALGERGRAATLLAELARRYPQHPSVLEARARLLADSGRYDDAHALAARVRGTGVLADGRRLQAELDAARGRVDEAVGHLRDVQSDAVARGDLGAALELAAAAGRLRVAAGDPGGAAEVDAALAQHPVDSIDVLSRPYLPLARFYAETGHPRRAWAWLDAYARELPAEFRGPDRWMLHQARAAAHLAAGAPAEALAELRAAERTPALRVGLFDDEFLPAGARPELARVHDALGAADSAIAAYERYLGARSLGRPAVDAIALGPALERLGALYERRGDRVRAAASYARLAALWREADPALARRAVAASRRGAALAVPSPAR
jgi:DNA-binding SARP family transcriptional activator/TolB-like protein